MFNIWDLLHVFQTLNFLKILLFKHVGRTAVLEVDNADFSWTTPDIHDNQTQQIVTNDNIADDTSSNAKPSKTLRLQNISLKIEEVNNS